jgi:hypothetical protein
MRLLALVMVVTASSSCAVTSSVTLPSCADRLEVGGQHDRRGRAITFDHTFDLPMSRTEVTLKGPDRSETINIWNNQPDGGRLLIGIVSGIGGGVLWISALHEVTANGRSFSDEGPFYEAVLGTSALFVGALLSLTGWHPRQYTELEGFCH